MPQQYNLFPAEQIGAGKWNELVEKNQIDHPYMQYEYISICSEGKWKVLTDEDRTFYMPVPMRTKMGYQHVFNPPYMQRCYLLFKDGRERLSAINTPLAAFSKKVRKVSLSLDHDFPALPSGFSKFKKRNYIHQYGQPVILSHHHQRNMRKAKVQYYNMDWQGDAGELLQAYIKNTLSRRGRRKYQLKRIATKLLDWAQNNGHLKVALARDRKGNAAAGMGLIHWEGRLYNLFPYTSQKGWEDRAMYQLLFHCLKENPYDTRIFDFEGSEIPGVARFYKGFGPQKESYYGIEYINKPFIWNVLDTATKWFR